MSSASKQKFLPKSKVSTTLFFPIQANKIIRKVRTNLYGSFDRVGVFKNFQPQVVVELRVVGKEFVDDAESFFAPLAADERTEPSIDKKYLAVRLVVRQFL